MKGLSSNGIGKYFLNEETAVDDFERKVYRVESVQPWGCSLGVVALPRVWGLYEGRKLSAWKA